MIARTSQAVVALASLGLWGCFVDQATAVDRVCVAGQETCECMEDAVCSESLECTQGNICRSARCTPGRENCECNAGACDPGLTCEQSTNSCLAPVTNTSTNANAEDALFTDAFPQSTGVQLDFGTVDPQESGCGWIEADSFYFCGEALPEESMDPQFPRACPMWVQVAFANAGAAVLGAPCEPPDVLGSTKPVSFQGCCLGPVVVFCDNEDLSSGAIDGLDCSEADVTDPAPE